jgi:ABC-2 type transport system permease protein
MMARLPFGVEPWQLALSMTILVLSFLFCVWFAAKIYRVGILMYGKKPSFKELYHWTRYKN